MKYQEIEHKIKTCLWQLEMARYLMCFLPVDAAREMKEVFDAVDFESAKDWYVNYHRQVVRYELVNEIFQYEALAVEDGKASNKRLYDWLGRYGMMLYLLGDRDGLRLIENEPTVEVFGRITARYMNAIIDTLELS